MLSRCGCVTSLTLEQRFGGVPVRGCCGIDDDAMMMIWWRAASPPESGEERAARWPWVAMETRASFVDELADVTA